jgi:thiosulfate dehydrogenase
VPRAPWIPLIVAACLASACARRPAADAPRLVAASTTMVTAWQVPSNPLEDKTLDKSPLAEQVRWGYQIFTDTPTHARRFTGGGVSCANCHLNAGQRERALPIVGVAGMFPEYNARAARLITLADRVVDCFMRSENATGAEGDERPTPTSKEVLALSAYISWLSRGQPVGRNPASRGQNSLAAAKLIPVDKLDAKRGEAIYLERCTSCHGEDGQGKPIGDKKAGPLWGPHSWNDGAGAARVYTLAGIIRYTMPYLDPGSLSDEDAQHVARFITSQPRPVYPYKQRDYAGGKVPVDAVYYRAAPPEDVSGAERP